ncbi:MAG: nitrogen fixation protein NifA, partial [Bdellovibrionaceae bacterium]|nr:nitrogen fixation protein NifA [Pseudobdellovibrionaceae bacterium]
MSMINWDEFEHIHVIRKLKQILGSWWNIDVVFTDERGHLKGFELEKTTFHNPSNGYLLQKEAGQSSLADLVMKAVEDLRTTSNRYSLRKWDIAGYDVGVFPIYIQNDFVGCVVGVGFFKNEELSQRPLEVRERLAALGATVEL